MNAAPFYRLVVAGAVLLSARCLWAQAVPSVETTNAPAFEPAAGSNAQYLIRQRLYPVLAEHFESPFDVTNSEPAALAYDWAYTNTDRAPPAGPVRPHINLYFSAGQSPAINQPAEPVDRRFEYLPRIEFTNIGHTADSTALLTNQPWGDGLLDLEVAADPAPLANRDQPKPNVTGSEESPLLFDIPATNADSLYSGALYFP